VGPLYQEESLCIEPDSTCCGASPIIFNLDGGGFDLCGTDDAVWFDLFVVGHKERFFWLARGSRDGFLVLDRNGNGTIDDGKELFGNHTPLPNGSFAPTGCAALAAFDQPGQGGNGDGVIDSRDAVFKRLRIWIDVNHNGISERGELHTLKEMGIVRIELGYRDSRRRDRYASAAADDLLELHERADDPNENDVLHERSVHAGGQKL
jgi:hypothetical protein